MIITLIIVRRLSTLGLTDTYVPLSLNLLSSVSRYVSNGSTPGILQQVVDPLDWSKQGKDSAEGQSFVILAYAAHKTWDGAGRKGATTDGDGLGSFTSAAARRWAIEGGAILGLAGAVMGGLVAVLL